jgi:hypothetical protein
MANWALVAAIAAVFLGLISLVSSWWMSKLSRYHSSAIQLVSRNEMAKGRFANSIERIGVLTGQVSGIASDYILTTPNAIAFVAEGLIKQKVPESRKIAGECLSFAAQMANEYKNLAFTVASLPPRFGPTAQFQQPGDIVEPFSSVAYLHWRVDLAHDWILALRGAKIRLPMSGEDAGMIDNVKDAVTGMQAIEQVDNLWRILESWEQMNEHEIVEILVSQV